MINPRLQAHIIAICAILLFNAESAWPDGIATTTVRLPNGEHLTIEHPEEATKEEVIKLAEAKAKAKAKEMAEYQKASDKRYRIYNACYLDKSKGLDLSSYNVKRSLRNVCDDIADDPSWLESMKYD